MTQKLMVSKLYLTESFPTHPLSLAQVPCSSPFFMAVGKLPDFPTIAMRHELFLLYRDNGRNAARTTPLYPHPLHSNPHRLSSPSVSFHMWHPPTWGVFCNVRFLLCCLLLAPNLHLPSLQTNPSAHALSSFPCPPLWTLIRSQVSEWSLPPLPY